MRRLSAVLIAVAGACLGLLAIGGAPQATLARATSSGGWGNAHRVPGVAALAPRGFAYAVSLSCASQPNCTIGGWYTTRTGNRNLSQAFSVRDVNGAWKLPQRIPGLVVPAASFSTLSALSCAAQGNCVAAGDPGLGVARVVNQTRGVWGRARQVPGLAALSGSGALSTIDALSCSAAGWCVAAGNYWHPPNGFPHSRGSVTVVVIEHNGVWQKARLIPGMAALNHGWLALISSISCDRAGACTAGGTYRDRSTHALRPFVVSQHRGVWTPAHAIAGVTALPNASPAGESGIGAISCTSPGNCTAAGRYTDTTGNVLPFVVTEKNGVWGQAQSLPGTVPLDPKFNQAAITGMSCPAPGQCSAAGFYGSDLNAENVSVPFVATQVNGKWGAAHQVPGLAALNLGNQGAITSVWCGTPGNCAAGGFYTGPGGSNFHSDVPGHAFLVTESGRVWSRAIPVPGLAALGSRASGIAFVFCGQTNKCIGIGGYTARAGFVKGHLFVVARG